MNAQRIVKSYAASVLLVVLLSLNGFTQEDRTPTITKTFDMDQPGTLNAKSSGGGVEVIAQDQKKVVVQVFIRKNFKVLPPSDPAIDDVLEDYDLDIDKNGSVINAIVERKSRFTPWNNAGISLIITVPREMSCNVSSSGGGLRISGVEGSHNFTSSGGGVHLENTTGTTKASSSGGRVTATNHTGDINLNSSGGGVSLDGARGTVYAHSSGGAVHLNNINGDVDAGSSGGGVTVNGEAGYVKARSSGGSVHVDISGLSKELHLESSGGGVDATIRNGDKLGLDLDLSSQKVNIELHNFSGRVEKNYVRGTLNNGGIPVYMHASGGNINVRFED
ncbi:MAG: DUF4097 family beta strand repeat-containing protein [Bacteroidales bacterium]